MIESGQIKVASATCFTPSEAILRKIEKRAEYFRSRLILRPIEISNCIEVIRRLGVIALNTPLEVDIYGQVNSTHLMGTKMMNAIEGSGDFARNAYLSVFTTTSTTKEDKVLRILPMFSHADHTEYDWHVLITEQGVADLRGLSPRERAISIIKIVPTPNIELSLKITTGAHVQKVDTHRIFWQQSFKCRLNSIKQAVCWIKLKNNN